MGRAALPSLGLNSGRIPRFLPPHLDRTPTCQLALVISNSSLLRLFSLGIDSQVDEHSRWAPGCSSEIQAALPS